MKFFIEDIQHQQHADDSLEVISYEEGRIWEFSIMMLLIIGYYGKDLIKSDRDGEKG